MGTVVSGINIPVENAFSILLYIAITIMTVGLASRVVPLRAAYCGIGTRRSCMNKLYLAGIFVVLFLLSVLRFDVGNDYVKYTETAHEIWVGGYVVTEPGFNAVVRIVYDIFGAECYEVIFALFALLTLMLFLKALYEQSEDFLMSYALFMLLGLYFQTFNTVRYYFALAVVLYAMRYVVGKVTRKDFLKFTAWIIVAAFFHKSVLITIPVIWVAGFAWKKWQILTGVCLSIVCYLFKGPLLNLALVLYPSYRDTIYLEGEFSIVTVLRCLLVFLFYVWYRCRYKTQNDEELRFYAQLNLVALVAGSCFSFLPVVTRIVYYFSVTQLLLISAIVCRIPDEKSKRILKICIYVVMIGYFLVFLWKADRPGVQLIPYDTWLFHEDRYIYY